MEKTAYLIQFKEYERSKLFELIKDTEVYWIAQTHDNKITGEVYVCLVCLDLSEEDIKAILNKHDFSIFVYKALN